MVDPNRSLEPVEGPGLRVSLDRDVRVAALRYFHPTGDFAARAADAAGMPLPTALKASASTTADHHTLVVLAWRSPTETILLCGSRSAFENIQRLCCSADDGCFIDQTGGLIVLHASGARFADLFSRIGNIVALPGAGESKRSLMADVPVLAVRQDGGDTYLILDRLYREHLMNWIRETAADLLTSTSEETLVFK